MKLMILTAGLATCMAAVGQTTASAPPQVRTQQGVVEGVSDGQGQAVFQGVPYAAPPVGGLRWKAPQGPASWQGVRAAKTAPHSCMQIDWGWNSRDAHDESEDCLYLNIATPSLKPEHPLPVIFWIHGGANYNGSGRYGAGQTLTQHGVVLVSINYRLGVFGFLAHPELTAESPRHTSGNYALLDQLAALRWVQANVAAFGGDPQRVTIAGQSAGAIDAGLLMTSPESKGLFAGVIEESGSAITPKPILPNLKGGEATGQGFATFVGAPAGPGQIAALRKMTAEQLLDAANRYAAPDNEGVPTHEGPEPIVDGGVLAAQPAQTLRDGTAQRVPLLAGNNIQEFTFGGSSVSRPDAPPDPADALKRAITRALGDEAATAIGDYGLTASDAPAPDPQLGSAGTQFMTDSYFRCPARIAGKWLSQGGDAVWEYQFERALPGSGSNSTRHSGELPYVFGWAQRSGPGMMGATYGPEDAALSEQMQGYWSNFAKTGDPNGAGLPAWPKFGGAGASLMHFRGTGSAAAEAQPRAECVLYEKHLASLLTYGSR